MKRPDEIKLRDIGVLLTELLDPGRLIILALSIGAVAWAVGNGFQSGIWSGLAILGSLATGLVLANAYRSSVKNRFHDRRYYYLWTDAQERYQRFREAHALLKKRGKVDLEMLPGTIENTRQQLYLSLRRADILAHEIRTSERNLFVPPMQSAMRSQDPQAQELYRLADRNMAEYRSNLADLRAGVERTEAQAAVFTSTLDTLRVKMLGYRLATRSPEGSSLEFMNAIAEAKMQLDAIDKTLLELELTPFPATIAVMPPPMPGEVREDNRT